MIFTQEAKRLVYLAVKQEGVLAIKAAWEARTLARFRKAAVMRARRVAAARRKATHTPEEWEARKEATGGHCVRCWRKRTLTKDHIVPLYQSGHDGIDNLQPLCLNCNNRKGPENYDWFTHRMNEGVRKVPYKIILASQ